MEVNKNLLKIIILLIFCFSNISCMENKIVDNKIVDNKIGDKNLKIGDKLKITFEIGDNPFNDIELHNIEILNIKNNYIQYKIDNKFIISTELKQLQNVVENTEYQMKIRE